MADFMGVVGALFYAVSLLGIDFHHYVENSQHFVGNFDLFAGVFKSLFFGAAIALIACYRGFHCDPGAEGVGPGRHRGLRVFVRHDLAAGLAAGHRPGRSLLQPVAGGAKLF